MAIVAAERRQAKALVRLRRSIDKSGPLSLGTRVKFLTKESR
jgi:hypothetical protein